MPKHTWNLRPELPKRNISNRNGKNSTDANINNQINKVDIMASVSMKKENKLILEDRDIIEIEINDKLADFKEINTKNESLILEYNRQFMDEQIENERNNIKINTLKNIQKI